MGITAKPVSKNEEHYEKDGEPVGGRKKGC